MKHIVKIEIDNKRYGIPEEVFNYIRQCCDKIQELEDENKKLNVIVSNEFSSICETEMINKLSASELILVQEKKIEDLEEENERLNKIINEFEKVLEEHEATYTLNELKKLKREK